MVALTRLIGLVLPCTLVRMLVMPQAWSTSRTPGPALTPVPGPAGHQDDPARAVLADDAVRDGVAAQRDLLRPLDVPLAFLDRLLDGGRHFVGLAVAVGNAAALVADDDQGVEAEPPAALDHAGAAANLDDEIDQRVVARVAYRPCPVVPAPSSILC